MLDFFKKLVKIGAITEFVVYGIFSAFIIFGGFWTDFGMVSLIMLHKFGKIFS